MARLPVSAAASWIASSVLREQETPPHAATVSIKTPSNENHNQETLIGPCIAPSSTFQRDYLYHSIHLLRGAGSLGRVEGGAASPSGAAAPLQSKESPVTVTSCVVALVEFRLGVLGPGDPISALRLRYARRLSHHGPPSSLVSVLLIHRKGRCPADSNCLF